MFRDDWLHRQIEQLAAAIARALGLSRKEQPEEALRELERAWTELLPEVPRGMADTVEAGTLRALLRTPERVNAVVQLLVAEGQVHAAAGDIERAGACFRIADSLR